MVNPSKVEEVNRLKDIIKKGKTVAIANIRGIPTRDLQRIRKEVRNLANMRVSKKRLIIRALKETGYEDLANELEKEKEVTALLSTNENIFKIAKIFMEHKVNVPIKAGEIAPKDIVIPKGITNIPVGPIQTELRALGVKTKVTSGKIEIVEDAVVVKEGEIVSPKVANVLQTLGIKPIERQVTLIAAKDEVFYDKQILNTPLDLYIEQLKDAYIKARGLAIELAIPTKEIIDELLIKAHRSSIGLAIELGIPSKEVIDQILIRAENAAKLLYDEIKDKIENSQ